MVCRLCDSADVHVLYSNNSFCIYHCQECDLKHKEYPESYDFNKMVYEDDGWIDERDKTRSYWSKSRKKSFGSFRKFLRPGSFLEVGLGDGWFLKYALDNGYAPIGIETSKRNVEYIERVHGIRCFQGRLEDAGIEHNSTDNILLSHLLEHIENPKPFLSNINQLLKPNGRLIILTPNAASYTERLFKGDNSFYNAFDHISFFTPKSIAYAARITGFEVTKIFTREAYFDLNNKLTTYVKIKVTGRRCRFLKSDTKGHKIDVYSSGGVYSTTLAIAGAVRRSSVVWGQIFRIFALLGMGSELGGILTKK